MNNPSKIGDWVTNHPKTMKGYWPRRSAKYKEGPPKGTETYTVEQLQQQGIIGIYLDEDVPEGLKSKEIIYNNK